MAATGRLAGFHVHAGSMLDDETVADLVVAALEPLYADFPDADLVDFGGGLAVPHAPLVGFAAAYERFVERSGKRVLLEPGRFVIAEAGTLLTRVLHVKEGARRHVIADAGMADLLRPALYGARHPVHLVEAGGGSRGSEGSSVEEGGRGGVQSGLPTDVDGPLCENADRLGQDVELPAAAAGDLLAVGTAGAYGFAMASNYAGSLRPAEVAVRAGEARLVRRRSGPKTSGAWKTRRKRRALGGSGGWTPGWTPGRKTGRKTSPGGHGRRPDRRDPGLAAALHSDHGTAPTQPRS